MKDLKEKAVQGSVAKILGQGVSFALRIVSMMVLSRLLDPKDFGLVAMVTVVTGIYGMFTSLGLSSATIQRDTVTDQQISTLFWVNLLTGAVLGLLCLVSAPILVAFYHEPRLFWVTVAMAAGFLFNSAGVQHYALLERQLRYVDMTVIDTLSSVVSLSVGIGMAFGGFGYWALVAMTIVKPAISLLCVLWTTRWIPGRPSRGAGVGAMLRFGGTITLNNLVVYVGYNLEKILLGRFWGADSLGIYGRAYSLNNLPTESLNGAVGVVAFSALSRLQNDPERLKNYFLKGYTLVLAMTLPITLFCALFADDIILVLLGPKWTGAVAIFRLLTPTVLIFGMINPLGWFLISSGLQVRSLKIGLVLAPLVILAYVVGLPYGPKGVAWAYSGVLALWLVPHILWCLHGTIISLGDLLQAMRIPFLSGIVAAVFAFGVRFYCDGWLIPLPRLLLGGAVMLGAYLWMLLFVMGQKKMYLDLLRGLRGRSSIGKEVAEMNC